MKNKLNFKPEKQTLVSFHSLVVSKFQNELTVEKVSVVIKSFLFELI
jgi:hypothetical protein